MLQCATKTEEKEVNTLKTALTVIGIIAVVLLVLAIILYFVGRRMQRKQAAQQKQIDAAKQVVSMLVIDKGKRKLKEAGLPAIVLEQTPKYMRGVKFPIVKAKVGPKVMSFICDAKVFDLIPIKKSVKATISGIYITDVRPERGGTLLTPEKKKQGFFARLRNKAEKTLEEQSAADAKNSKKKKKK